LAIIGGVICCGLCAYGISTAVRRSREQRGDRVYPATTH
jgi:hypothetical protein